jgi:hypothetical protein
MEAPLRDPDHGPPERRIGRASASTAPRGTMSPYLPSGSPYGTFLKAPWGPDWDELCASDIIWIDQKAQVVGAKSRGPSAPTLHLEFYEDRSDNERERAVNDERSARSDVG